MLLSALPRPPLQLHLQLVPVLPGRLGVRRHRGLDPLGRLHPRLPPLGRVAAGCRLGMGPVRRTLELEEFIRQFDRHGRSLRAGLAALGVRLVAE